MATYASLAYNFGTQITGGVPTAAIADNAITLAKMASGTDGNIITYDASGNPAAVSTGSSGQILTSGGTGVAPTMTTVSGSGVILQVVNNVDFNTPTFTSTAADAITVTINNVAASSYCWVQGSMTLHTNGSATQGGEMTLTRGNTNLFSGAGGNLDAGTFMYRESNYGGSDFYIPISCEFLDTSPATGSNTYKIRFRAYAGSPRVAHDGAQQITVMEIAV